MNLKGNKFKKKLIGYEARVFAHEFDHLQGVCYIDHLDQASRQTVQPVLDDLVNKFGDGGVL